MPRSGHPPVSDENVQPVSAFVEVDRNVTIHQFEQDTGLAHSEGLTENEEAGNATIPLKMLSSLLSATIAPALSYH